MTDQTTDIAGMNVLLGPGDTASFPTRLARALAERGADCRVVDFSLHRFSAGPGKLGNATLWGAPLARAIGSLNNGGPIARALGSVLKTVGQAVVFVWSLLRVDAYVFVSSRSLLPGYLDLPIYRLLGKRVIRVFLGTDSRPRYMTGWHNQVTDPATQKQAAAKLARRVRRQRARVRWMSRWADLVVENPLCGHYQARPFINWFHVGFPHDPAFFPDSENAEQSTGNHGPTRILHCPSNPAVKGTDRIEQVIDELKQAGIEIEYTRITGMPHAEVLRHLQQCDLVIDELYSDSPMAGFASEAAAYGKPAIVGGYGWDILQSLLQDNMPPNLLCEPDQLANTVNRALDDPETARATGRAAHAFMNGYWHQSNVAERFARLLTGQDIPDNWWYNPKQIAYWQGLGATAEHRREVISALVKQHGVEGLGVDAGSAMHDPVTSWGDA